MLGNGKLEIINDKRKILDDPLEQLSDFGFGTSGTGIYPLRLFIPVVDHPRGPDWTVDHWGVVLNSD